MNQNSTCSIMKVSDLGLEKRHSMPQLFPVSHRQANKRPARSQNVVKTPVVFTGSGTGPCIATYTVGPPTSRPSLPSQVSPKSKFSPLPKPAASHSAPSTCPASARQISSAGTHVSSVGTLPGDVSELRTVSTRLSLPLASTKQASSCGTLPGDVTELRTVSTRLAVPPPRQTLQRHVRRQIETLRPGQREDDAVRIYRALYLPRHTKGEKKLPTDSKALKRCGDCIDRLKRWVKAEPGSVSQRLSNSEADLSAKVAADPHLRRGSLSHRDPLSNISEVNKKDVQVNTNSTESSKGACTSCDVLISSDLTLENDAGGISSDTTYVEQLANHSALDRFLQTGTSEFTPEHLLEGLVKQLEDTGGLSRRAAQQTGARYSWVPLSICSL